MTGTPVNFHRDSAWEIKPKYEARRRRNWWRASSIFLFSCWRIQLPFKQARVTDEKKSWWVKRGLKTSAAVGEVFTWEVEGSTTVPVLHQSIINTVTGDSSLVSGEEQKEQEPRRMAGKARLWAASACHPSERLQLVSVPSLGPFSGPGTMMINRIDSGTRWPGCSGCRLFYVVHELRPSSLTSTEVLELTLGWRKVPSQHHACPVSSL